MQQVFQVIGYPKHYYFVEKMSDWVEVCKWMKDSKIEYLQVYSGPIGFGFSVHNNLEWFALRWL